MVQRIDRQHNVERIVAERDPAHIRPNQTVRDLVAIEEQARDREMMIDVDGNAAQPASRQMGGGPGHVRAEIQQTFTRLGRKMCQQEVERRHRGLHVREVPGLPVVLRTVAVRQRQNGRLQRAVGRRQIAEALVDPAEPRVAFGLVRGVLLTHNRRLIARAGEIENAIGHRKCDAAPDAADEIITADPVRLPTARAEEQGNRVVQVDYRTTGP